MKVGQEVIVNGSSFGRKHFDAVIHSITNDEFISVMDEYGDLYVISVSLVRPFVSIEKSEWVLKNDDGDYVRQIGSRRVVWTNKLANARVYTYRHYAESSLNNYGGKELVLAYPVKIKTTMTEVYE